MNITLIQSPLWTTHNPPYNLSLLKAVLEKQGHRVFNLDLNIELYHCISEKSDEKDTFCDTEEGNKWEDKAFVLGIIEKYKCCINEFIAKILNMPSRVIGFTVSNKSRLFAMELAKIIKEKDANKILIFGGPECFRDARGFDLHGESYLDAICTGEGEICFGNMLGIIEKKGGVEFCKGFIYRDNSGEIVDCGDPDVVEDLNALPFAVYSDFDISKYRMNKKTSSTMPILTSKGCIYRCSFCSESVRMKKYRSRSGHSVYSEIKFLLDKYPFIEEFSFSDSLINGDIKMLNELCDLIIENNMHFRWGGQACIRKEMTRDFLIKLKRAGCEYFGFGVESGSNRILKLMNKKFTAELAAQVIRDCHEAGMQPNFNIIVGFPYETDIEFQETLNFLKTNSAYANHIWLNICSVTVGSELWKDRERLGIKCYDNGLDWELADGSNNHEVRSKRFEICLDILEKKARFNTYKKPRKDTSVVNLENSRRVKQVDTIKTNNDISFNWDIHWACNYRCPYCWFYGKWAGLKKHNRYLEIGKLMNVWYNIYEKYGTIKISITGGEPFLYPGFRDFIAEVSQIHKVEIITNLSADIQGLVKNINCENVKINPSFHSMFANLDDFIGKACLLKEKGLLQCVSYLAWPPLISKIEYYTKKFIRHGISMSIQSFFGEYKNIRYPDGYTEEEKKIMLPNIGERGGRPFQTESFSTRGKTCAAGHKYGVIHPDGKVLRCGGINSSDGASEIGNLFEERFKLLDGLLTCTFDICPCNEWAFLLKET